MDVGWDGEVAVERLLRTFPPQVERVLVVGHLAIRCLIVMFQDPPADPCKMDGELSPPRISLDTRSRPIAPAQPKLPDARSSWRTAESSGSEASAGLGGLWLTTCQSRGRPCRHRSSRCPCVGLHRCHRTCFPSARSPRSAASRAGHRLSLTSRGYIQNGNGCP